MNFLVNSWDLILVSLLFFIVPAAFKLFPLRRRWLVRHIGFLILSILSTVSLWAVVGKIEAHERHEQAEKLLGYAPTYAWTLEQMGYGKLNENTKPNDPLYLKFIEFQKGWAKANPFITDIYTLKKGSKGDNLFIVDSETDYNKNTVFEEDREARTSIGEKFDKRLPELELAFQGQNTFTFDPYTDRWGHWVSSFVPIRNNSGEVIGVLGLDFPAEDYLSGIKQYRIILVACILLSFLTVFCLLLIEHKHQHYSSSLEEALSKAEAATSTKSNFLAIMSHEIRTPLNGILGMINLISDQTLNEEVRRQIGVMKTCGVSLMTLINDILDFSKIEAKKLVLEYVTFKPDIAVKNVIELLSPMAEEKGVKIIYLENNEPLQWVKSDVGRFQQVLTNLINNAIKFTPKGSVTIQTSQEILPEKKIRIHVRIADTGIGIEPESQKKLFQSFSQVDGSTTRKFGGTGLGLSICKGIVEAMNGTISLESTYGMGSTFTFNFLAEATTALITDDIPELDSNRAKKYPLRILVADDHSTNCLLAEQFLLKLGYKVECVTNGVEVLDLINTKFFDVIFMDCQMPEMDGFVATTKIHQRFSKETRPWIIALTASALPEDRERCFQVGMDDFVTKPFNLVSLTKALDNVKLRTRNYKLELVNNLQESDEEPILDQKAINRHYGGQTDILAVAIDAYLKTAPKMIEEIKHAIDQTDAVALRMATHKLRGSVSNFFSKNIVSELKYLEALGKSQEIADAKNVFSKTQIRLKKLTEELERMNFKKDA